MKKIDVLAKINEIQDPDIGIGLVDLGLVYDVELKGKEINITMTLTTPACPLAGTFENQIKEKIPLSENIKNIHIEWTFDPPWSKERISEETRMRLGLLI